MVKSCKDAIIAEGGDPDASLAADVVVIGSGGAGLAAAIQASEEGARVIIVEKCRLSAAIPLRPPPG